MEYSGPLARPYGVCIYRTYTVCVPNTRVYTHTCMHMCARVQTREWAATRAAHALQVTKRDVSGSSAPWNLRDWDDIRRAISLPRPPSLYLSIYLSVSPFAKSLRSARTNLIRGEFPERARRPECNL